MRTAIHHIAFIACASLAALGAAAQTDDGGDGGTGPANAPSVLGQVQSQMPPAPPADNGGGPAILVLNQERLLSQSLYGQRIQDELAQALRALAAENREIEAQLTEEELSLTDQRPSMTPEDFRAVAEEFDIRVTEIREAQAAKNRSLQSQAETAQGQFFELASPLLLDIVQTRGAAVLMDSRAVLLSADGIDITDQALVAINEALGEGGAEALVSLDAADTQTIPGPTPRPAP
ncbi:MAG: OmpH family outer membrane protein [Pseudomonadota bacterium]